ncbi:gamma-aminobutyric acid receptor subunit beta-1 isoform X3 [Ixodes scapularis]|uniref:gamma-aminobutyric acid receptor subunit beta-1 isoform X3 n=1 Tax=Ixodes scapularis TaxID=6945 RepID=UPI001A9E579F|nr:gamma-aminobutyric acid receptor subunit beta-1 isoform X3 [Ixodes scapularis]
MSAHGFPWTLLLFLAVVGEVAITRYGVDALIEAQDIVFTNLTDKAVYNKRVRPAYSTNLPVVVNTSIVLYSMASTNDLHTEYTAQMRLRQTWFDQRLRYDAAFLHPEAKIQGDHWHAERIWLPSVQVTNMRNFDSVTGITPASVLIVILADGQVHVNRRLHLKLKCEMEFHKYPLDKQKCSLKIESSMLSTKNMLLQWEKEQPLQFSNTFDIKGFQMVDFNCSSGVEDYDHTAFVFFILLEYAMVNYIYHKDNRRRQGGIRRIDSQASMGSSANSLKNSSSYLNILAALEQGQTSTPSSPTHKSQCTVQISKYKKNHKLTPVFKISDLEAHTLSDLPDSPPRSPISLRSFTGGDEPYVCTLVTPLTPRDIANGIDRHSRYLFPLAFIIFNCIYWYVLTSS